MSAVANPPLWRVHRGQVELHVFAGRPPLPVPWSAPAAQAVLATSAEFWHETPEVTPETQAIALQHGIHKDRPLETFLSESLRARLSSTASGLGVAPALIAPMRPWLAAQMLRTVSDARRGLDRSASPESVLRRRAEEAGIPIKTEFPSVGSLMAFFGALPSQAQAEMLALELDDLEAGAPEDLRRAELWLEGDLTYEEEHASNIQRRYPSFYEHLAVERNRAWVPRIISMLDARTRAFIAVGLGHMVGPASIPTQLENAGIAIHRLE